MRIHIRKKIGLPIGIFIAVCIIFISIFTVYSNNQITISEQRITISDLPLEFENFTILQITDLHERVFGEEQQKLLSAINSVDYDAIVFTGDMLDDPESKNYDPFYTLIDGIWNKDMAFFVPGNTDPQSFILNRNDPLEKDEFIKGMEKRGVLLLDSVKKVERGDASLYFTYFENSIIAENSGLEKTERVEKLQKELSILDTLTESDHLIALNHYPIPDKRVNDLKKHAYKFRNYDLIIAGHYHGGQIRLPFVGALFVPEPYYFWDGLFPPQDRVKGLWEYDGIQQYVSTGLGSSDAIFFMKFRFLNPPEINILTLSGE